MTIVPHPNGGWRWSVDALGTPTVTLFTLREAERAFDLQPMVWKGVARATA